MLPGCGRTFAKRHLMLAQVVAVVAVTTRVRGGGGEGGVSVSV